MRKALLAVSVFTVAVSGWLVAMEMLLRRQGYVAHAGEELCIGLIGLVTAFASAKPFSILAERCLLVPAVILIIIGGQAFLRNNRAVHFEGYIFVISIVLV